MRFNKLPNDIPTILHPLDSKDRNTIAVIKANKSINIVDTIESLLTELYCIRNPQTIRKGLQQKNLKEFIRQCIAPHATTDTFGVWVWYPWNMTLVHFLPEEYHQELRTSRNRNLITKDEQQRYYDSCVGVAGLSVGSSVVASILHTGGAKYMRLADHDELSGSNTNRIRAGFNSVGISKITLVAREIFLTNPYAELQLYPKGLTVNMLDRFLTYPKRLDIVIDEMDNLYMKIQLRLAARKLRIPVIMAADNGDGIVVDIERFDLDPKRPLMHGNVPEKTLLQISDTTSRIAAAQIISTWVGPENISTRMKDSLSELGQTLYTWPQLGNAAFMAGSILAYVCRKIILDDPLRQGKFVINPDSFFVPHGRGAKRHKERIVHNQTFTRITGI